MSNTEQQPDSKTSEVKRWPRVLLISSIIVLCLAIALYVGWYFLLRETADFTRDVWENVQEASGRSD